MRCLSLNIWLVFSPVEVCAVRVLRGLLGPRWRPTHLTLLVSRLKVLLRRDPPLTSLNRRRDISLRSLHLLGNSRRRPLDFSGLRLRLIKRRLLVLRLKIILILAVVGAGRLRYRRLPLTESVHLPLRFTRWVRKPLHQHHHQRLVDPRGSIPQPSSSRLR